MTEKLDNALDKALESALDKAGESDDQVIDADRTGVSDDGQDSDETDESSASEAARRQSRRLWLFAAAALVTVAIAGGAFGYVKYRNATNELAALHQAEADRAAAVQLAKDYAFKSLTYSYKDPDAFFRSVQDGVSPTLKDKYTNAVDLLKGIMLQAQVTSSGEILATEAIPQPGNVYQVVVSASQSTRNLQHPEPRVSLSLLQITVNKVGDKWQVTDIGPKAGTKAPDTGPIPPAPTP